MYEYGSDSELTLEESPEGAFEHFIVGPKCWPKRYQIAFLLLSPITFPLYAISWCAIAVVAYLYGARDRM